MWRGDGVEWVLLLEQARLADHRAAKKACTLNAQQLLRQMPLDECDHLVGGGRFGEKGEAADDAAMCIQLGLAHGGGVEDDGDVLEPRIILQAVDDVGTVEVGHHDIKHNEVGNEVHDRFERLEGVVLLTHLVAA